MRREHLLLFAVTGFFTALIVFLIILYKPAVFNIISPSLDSNKNTAAESDADIIRSLNSKVKSLENNMALLSTEQNNQLAAIRDVETYISTSAAQSAATPTTKSIIAVASTKGSAFTTGSVNYTPMGMFVNVKCPKSCYLWINFYSSSQNTGSPASQQGYSNTYAVFLNEADQSIYSQANYPTASSSIPIVLSTVLPVNAGIYTVDVRAKTSGGTLQSNVSSLQVMVIER